MALVSRLQEENRKLSGALAEKRQTTDEPGTPPTPEVDVAVLQRLRSMVDKQREQIRAKDKELAIKTSELETVNTFYLCYNLKVELIINVILIIPAY